MSNATIAEGSPTTIPITMPAIVPPLIPLLLPSLGVSIDAAVVVGAAVEDKLDVEDPDAGAQSTVNWLMLVLE